MQGWKPMFLSGMVTKHGPRETSGEEKFNFHSWVIDYHCGKLAYEPKTEAKEECCLLALPGSGSVCYLVQPRTACLGNGAAMGGLLSHQLQSRGPLTDMPTGELDQGNPSK